MNYKPTKSLLIIIIWVIFSDSGYTQKIFEIDTLSGHIKDELPFDRSFVLKIKDKEKSLDKVMIYELLVKKGNIVFEKKTLTGKTKYGDTISIDVDFQHSADGFAYLHMPPLLPNQLIEVRLIHKFKGSQLNKLLEVYAKLFEGVEPEAKKIMHALITSLEPTFGGQEITAYGGEGWNENRWEKNKEFYNNKLKSHFTSIDTRTYNSSISNITKANLNTLETIAIAAKIDHKSIQKLWRLAGNNLLNDIFTGMLSAEDNSTTKRADRFDLEVRIKNLKKSFGVISEIKAVIDNIDLHNTANETIISQVLTDVKNIETQLISNHDFLKERFKLIRQEIEKEGNLRYTTWVAGDNTVHSLETAGKYHIIPDIGLATILAKGNNTDETYLRPYVGASIYFRPVNKDIPYKHLKNSFWHRFSLSLGLTTGAISGNEEFSDGLSSMSVLTGFNFKLTRAFALSSGTVWLKQKDKNPLIDDTTVVPRIYFGVAVDVDFVKTLEKLTSKAGIK